MRVNLMVGGPTEMIAQEIVKQRQTETWIGVDHGATWLLQHQIVPEMAIGDFDSTDSCDYANVQEAIGHITKLPTAKDLTDTQAGVALAIQRYQPSQIDIFGATGGRLDQLLANLYLPLQKQYRDYLDRIHFIDRQNRVAYYRPGEYSIHQLPDLPYLAFVNLTPLKGLELPDEKYPLHNWSSEIPFAWSSNEFTAAENHFSFKEGIVAVIQSADWPLTDRH